MATIQSLEQMATDTVHSLRVVKLRVNAAGNRRIGEIRLRPQQSRASDMLNEPEEFLALYDEVSEDGPLSESLLNKNTISYIEVVNEPVKTSQVVSSGGFRLVTVHLSNPALILDGELFVPRGFAVEAVLNDSRPFLNLRKVSIRNSTEAYSYLAIGKRQLIAVDVLGGVPD